MYSINKRVVEWGWVVGLVAHEILVTAQILCKFPFSFFGFYFDRFWARALDWDLASGMSMALNQLQLRSDHDPVSANQSIYKFR